MNKFYILMLAGLLLRLIFAFLPGFKFDMDPWFSWALRINDVGFSKFYSSEIWTNYTPGYLYILDILGFIKNIFLLSDEFFYYILKLPAIYSEIAIGILIFKIVYKHASFTYTKLAMLLIFLNPALIFNSAIWGQIDGLLTLCMLFTIYFLNKKRLVFSSIFFALALLIKPQAIAILPIYFLFITQNLKLKYLLKLTLPALLVIFILSLPFFPDNPFYGFLNLVQKMTGDYPYNSLNAYNLWGIIGFWIKDTNSIFYLSYQQISYILFFIYWIFISFLFFKKKISLYATAALACLAFYFLPTRVHERYLYPAIPFLVILFSIYKSKTVFILTTLLSLLHLFNLYYVYISYNNIYLNLPKVIYNPIVYDFISTKNYYLSFISTIVFILLTINIYRLDYENKKNQW